MVRIWAQRACRANSQSGKHCHQKPNCPLERMPPTDGLLAGIVCLSPALEYSLKDAIVAHVVRNMEDEGLNIKSDWILYSVSLPRASYFLFVAPEDCRGNTVGPDGAQEKSMKQKERGQGKTFERMT